MSKYNISKKENKSEPKLYAEMFAAVILMVLSVCLLKKDAWIFWKWWTMALVMGAIAMPVTGWLFLNFEDNGWMFSKVLAIAVTGFLNWFLVAIGIVPFNSIICIGVCIICAIGCFILLRHQRNKNINCYSTNRKLIVREELLFCAAFLLWTYMAGFSPQAYGTEKFMDYGFMEAMMRSSTLPAIDIWYSEGGINYYYGGQYFAVFLTKITGRQVAQTYNLMRTFIAAFAMILPFSLVRQMFQDRLATYEAGYNNVKRKKNRKIIPSVAGLTAGVAVSIAGNCHYIVYRYIVPLINQIRGIESEGYWYPDATRYIGYNPLNENDQTIHEFPCYSFVLGDLHAHVINIMFVLLLIGLLYAWFCISRKQSKRDARGIKIFVLEQLKMPHIIIASVLLGMFQFTNYWDFIIYLVVTGGVIIFANITKFNGKIKQILVATILQAIEIVTISYLVILPFTIKFETMVDGVALAQHHSLWYQMLVLWGLPSVICITLIVAVLGEKLKNIKKKNLFRIMDSISAPDLFAIIMALCAIGLMIIPEIVYVRDIYEDGNARANTMFKLTYQAYIMFGLTMGYSFYRMLVISREKVFKIISSIGLFIFIWTVGYFGNAVENGMGDVLKPANYQGLDATTYLETNFSADASAIRWLKENIKGSPVVLEANGDSYTDYERVSAATGLPTILGWYVHEWLWRNDTDDMNQKDADIMAIYTSTDKSEVEELLDKYNVQYIFVGSLEQEKYGDELNDNLLQHLGSVVYKDLHTGTYIVRIN